MSVAVTLRVWRCRHFQFHSSVWHLADFLSCCMNVQRRRLRDVGMVDPLLVQSPGTNQQRTTQRYRFQTYSDGSVWFDTLHTSTYLVGSDVLSLAQPRRQLVFLLVTPRWLAQNKGLSVAVWPIFDCLALTSDDWRFRFHANKPPCRWHVHLPVPPVSMTSDRSHK